MACLPHELIVWEILIRLPTMSLLRLQCVCKAWRDTISGADRSFSQAHLGRLHQQDRKPCSLLIAPCIQSKGDAEDPSDIDTIGAWPHRKVATPGLYLWEESRRRQGVATLLHDTSLFPTDKSERNEGLAHCDGLLLMPTDDTVHLLNPATRQVLKLPWSPNSVAPRPHYSVDEDCHQAFGFGRAHRSNTYTVARFFHRQTRGAMAMGDGLGMEVLIIGKDQYWRETSTQPPYPIATGRTATFFKGSLVWKVDCYSPMYKDNLPCFVRFTLEDESFSVIKGPPWYQGHNYFESNLAELNGELAMPRRHYGSVEIWMCDDVQGNKWEQRYAINSTVFGCPIATFDDEIVCRLGSLFLWRQPLSQDNIMVNMNALKYYNADKTKVVEYSRDTVKFFDVIFFIPTLVQI